MFDEYGYSLNVKKERTDIELDHEMVIDVSHRVSLEAKLVGEIDEDVLDFFLAERDLSI